MTAACRHAVDGAGRELVADPVDVRLAMRDCQVGVPDEACA